MPDNDPAKALDELIDDGTVMMLMTMVGTEHSSRPLTVAGVAGSRLSFLVDATTDWATAIRDGMAVVHATMADDRANTYVAVNGTASVTLDRQDIELLWNAGAAAFFDGPDDPALGVLHVDVSGGEYWTGPSGRLGAALQIVRAAMSRDADSTGEQGPVSTQ